MNIDNWNFFYKSTGYDSPAKSRCQMVYEPRINPEGNIFCMNFVFPCEYQTCQPREAYHKEFVDFMFGREVFYLDNFKNYKWIPEIIDIDFKLQRIFFRWYNTSCNHLVYVNKSLTTDTILGQLESIITEQVDIGYIKPNMYPHTYYIDSVGSLRTFDFYCCFPLGQHILEIDSNLKCLIKPGTPRTDSAIIDKKINILELFKSGLLEYSNWPGNLITIYEKLYGI